MRRASPTAGPRSRRSPSPAPRARPRRGRLNLGGCKSEARVLALLVSQHFAGSEEQWERSRRRNVPCLSCCFGCEIGDGRGGGRTRTSAARAARAIAASVCHLFFSSPRSALLGRGGRREGGGWRGFWGAGGAASSRFLPYHTRCVYLAAAPRVPGRLVRCAARQALRRSEKQCFK